MQEGAVELSILEDTGVPRFRLKRLEGGVPPGPTRLATIRPGGQKQSFVLAEQEGGYLESAEIPEPHTFRVVLELAGETHEVAFEDSHEGHAHDSHAHAAHRDHSIRSAYVHVLADAAVSVLAILGLTLAWIFGWNWMDPLAGIVGALVIANWSYRLIRDTGGVLLDVNPDRQLTARIRSAIERDGDRLTDLHLWRLGPGHLGVVLSVATTERRDCGFYRSRLSEFSMLSHVTVEVVPVRG
jgi:cation diffusion facilitator family transporter